MDQRHEQLLLGLVEEYVRTAEPVGSAALVRVLALDVSSATVRAMLHDLEEAGYVTQPHTSAGRVPTDAGYRYYVDHVRQLRLQMTERRQMERQYRQLEEQYQQMAWACAKLLAALTQTATVTAVPRRGAHRAGLRELFSQPEGARPEVVREVSEVVEAVEDSLPKLDREVTEAEPTVFIGREIPFARAEHTSVLLRRVRVPGQGMVTMVVIGPKRMAYQRNVSLLNALTDILEG